MNPHEPLNPRTPEPEPKHQSTQEPENPGNPCILFPMAPRPTWKGYLKVSLVNIPVKVFPATESAASVSFNQLHVECQTRIQQKKWCPACEREVPHSELVKGYEFEKGRYVVVSDDDI